MNRPISVSVIFRWGDCSVHAASFDLADGRISDGWSSPPLRLYPVRVAVGEVWIDAEAIKSSPIR
jgi:nitrite reductase/ring-hydroxylating ferredoxin subunit